MKKNISQQRGFTALLSILIIVSVGLLIAITISSMSMNEMQNTLSQNFSSEAFAFADSCTEEAIIRLKRADNYTGGTIQFGEIECDVQVTDNGGGNYTIEALASSQSQFYRALETEISVVKSGEARNITIHSWKEK